MNYDDIINLPHPVSKRHPQMSMRERAMQFASFKALSGYEDEIEETGRLTERRMELDEDQKEQLDLQLRQIAAGTSPEAAITWFCPDEKKEGGSYVTTTGRVRKIDPVQRLLFVAETAIAIDDILSIELQTEEQSEY